MPHDAFDLEPSSPRKIVGVSVHRSLISASLIAVVGLGCSQAPPPAPPSAPNAVVAVPGTIPMSAAPLLEKTAVLPAPRGPEFIDFCRWASSQGKVGPSKPYDSGFFDSRDDGACACVVAHDGAAGCEPLLQQKSDQFYVVDIDNNGVDEYVTLTLQGSGHYVALHVFERAGSTFRELDLPDTLFSDDFEMTGYPSGPLFTKLAGKTYISLGADIVWIDGRLAFACDDTWISSKRATFRALQKKSDVAPERIARDLENTMSRCAKSASPLERAWMKSDLAQSQYRMTERQECLKLVESAKSEVAHPPAELTAALERTGRDCLALDVGAPPIDLRGLDGGHVSESLVRSLVPSSVRRNVEWPLLGGPVEVMTPRGSEVSVAICATNRIGDCIRREAMIWADTARGLALYALERYDTRKCSVDVGSRVVSAASVPSEFWKALEKWSGAKGNACFVGDDGAEVSLKIP